MRRGKAKWQMADGESDKESFAEYGNIPVCGITRGNLYPDFCGALIFRNLFQHKFSD